MKVITGIRLKLVIGLFEIRPLWPMVDEISALCGIWLVILLRIVLI